jgi:hypothetical protein
MPDDAEIEADGLRPKHPARLSAQNGMRATASLRDRQKPDRRTADSPSCRASMPCPTRLGPWPERRPEVQPAEREGTLNQHRHTLLGRSIRRLRPERGGCQRRLEYQPRPDPGQRPRRGEGGSGGNRRRDREHHLSLLCVFASLRACSALATCAQRYKSKDRRYGGQFTLDSGIWWATLDSNQ